jgi:HEAT repeat protein
MAHEALMSQVEAERGDHARAMRLSELVGKLSETDRALAPRLAARLLDRDRFVRALACRGLGRIGGRTARLALLPALVDPAVEVRDAAWQALDLPADELAIPTLTRILRLCGCPGDTARPSTPPATTCATLALHALRERAEHAHTPLALPEPAIASAAAAPDAHLRAAGARLAAFLPDRPRAHSLVLSALDDDHPWVRESAARGAARAFTPRDAPILAELLAALAASREDGTRLALLHALGRVLQLPLPSEGDLSGSARAFLRAGDPGVRAAAVTLLAVVARQPDRNLVDDLMPLLDDHEDAIRRGAARLLGDLAPAGHERLVPALARAAARGDVVVVRSVIAAAARIATATARDLLVSLARGEDLALARAAARALAVDDANAQA